MLIEQITYVLHPGKAPTLVAAYEHEGAAVIQASLGRMIAFLHAEVGGMDEVSHLWAFADAADWEERHRKLSADPAWAEICPDVWASPGQPAQSALAGGRIFAAAATGLNGGGLAAASVRSYSL